MPVFSYWFYFLFPSKIMFVWHPLWCRFYAREMIWQVNKPSVGWLIYWDNFNRLCLLPPLLQPGHLCTLSNSLHFKQSYHRSCFGFLCSSYRRCVLMSCRMSYLPFWKLLCQSNLFTAAASGSCFLIAESIFCNPTVTSMVWLCHRAVQLVQMRNSFGVECVY